MRQFDTFKEIMENIPEEPVSLCKIARASGIRRNTVRNYLEMILYIQSHGTVHLRRYGFRLKIRKAYASD